MTDKNTPAFPFTYEDGGGGFIQHTGMTLRDWFAGQALAGLLAKNGEYEKTRYAASSAYEYADAMLEARDK